MFADPPTTRPWAAPITPVVAVRHFVRVAPYAAGGTSSVRLRATRGGVVRAPCSGVVTFRGSVAGSPPTLSVDCGSLRATLRWVRSGSPRGSVVRRGEAIGLATASMIGLSARLPDGTYRDPLALIGRSAPRSVPPIVVGGDRPRRSAEHAIAPRALAPIQLPASAFAAAGSGTAAGHGLRPGRRALTGPASPAAGVPVGRRVDLPLTAGGGALLAATGIASGAAWLRTRRRRRSTGHRAHLVGIRR